MVSTEAAGNSGSPNIKPGARVLGAFGALVAGIFCLHLFEMFLHQCLCVPRLEFWPLVFLFCAGFGAVFRRSGFSDGFMHGLLYCLQVLALFQFSQQMTCALMHDEIGWIINWGMVLSPLPLWVVVSFHFWMLKRVGMKELPREIRFLVPLFSIPAAGWIMGSWLSKSDFFGNYYLPPWMEFSGFVPVALILGYVPLAMAVAAWQKKLPQGPHQNSQDLRELARICLLFVVQFAGFSLLNWISRLILEPLAESGAIELHNRNWIPPSPVFNLTIPFGIMLFSLTTSTREDRKSLWNWALVCLCWIAGLYLALK